MAAKPLTNAIRDTLRENIVNHTFNERVLANRERESALAEKILDHVIGDANLRLMKQLPKEFFVTKSTISLRSETKGFTLRLKDVRAIPAYIAHSRVELPLTHGFWKEIRAVDVEDDAILKEKAQLRSEINAVLQSVRSVPKLLEVWPDIEPFLPKFEEMANLPAVRVEDLNRKIKKFAKK